MLKLSVFTVMIPDLTPEEGAKTLKETGYDGVEWRVTTVPDERKQEQPSFWGNNLCTLAPTMEEAERAGKLAQENGLEIPGLGTYIAVGDLEATENAMKFAQKCGARQIRVGTARTGQDDENYHDKFAASKQFLEGVQELAKQHNIRAMIEIHHKTITPSAGLAHRLVSSFDPEWIGVLHDAGNMVHEGFEDYAMGLELLGPYLYHVHIKNGAWDRPEDGGVWQSRWAPVEDGVVNWDNLFTALKKVGYDGWLGVEDFSAIRPTKEALAYNANFLREIIDRIYR